LILCGSMAALTLITPTAQAAETITVGFGADPTEEVPLPVTATWVSGYAFSSCRGRWSGGALGGQR
jgi:hypothetical protein